MMSMTDLYAYQFELKCNYRGFILDCIYFETVKSKRSDKMLLFCIFITGDKVSYLYI